MCLFQVSSVLHTKVKCKLYQNLFKSSFHYALNTFMIAQPGQSHPGKVSRSHVISCFLWSCVVITVSPTLAVPIHHVCCHINVTVMYLSINFLECKVPFEPLDGSTNLWIPAHSLQFFRSLGRYTHILAHSLPHPSDTKHHGTMSDHWYYFAGGSFSGYRFMNQAENNHPSKGIHYHAFTLGSYIS